MKKKRNEIIISKQTPFSSEDTSSPLTVSSISGNTDFYPVRKGTFQLLREEKDFPGSRVVLAKDTGDGTLSGENIDREHSSIDPNTGKFNIIFLKPLDPSGLFISFQYSPRI